MKKVIITVGIAMFLLGPVTGVFAAGDVVKVGYLRIVMSIPTFVAEEQGFFAQAGLKAELIPFQSGTTIIDALVAGRIDANCTSAITGHWFAEQNVPGRFKIFLTYGTPSIENPSFAAIVKKDSPIKDLKGLKGKKVGTFPGATSLALARAIIRYGAQMDPEGVIYTELPPPNLVGALASGQIDAFFAPEPFGILALSKGVGRHLVKEPLGLLGLEKGFAGAGFSFSAKFLKKSPEHAKKLQTAYYKAVDVVRKNKDAVRPLVVKHMGLPEPVAMRVPIQEWMKIEELNKEATQEYFDLLYKEGAYKKRIDTTKLYY